ncbi:MAG TPA: sodium:solute symporter family protein [Terriglobia bacterium]|nr:sodium:solute symporter family protein [Terriglobia bacterium]
MQISALDWVVIIGYFAVLAAIGIIASLRVKDTENYFMGKRRFGKLLMIAQSFGVGTHADMPVSLAGAVYTSGFSAIWYQWKNLLATPFYWIMAPVFRRVRRTTTAELMEDRYGPAMAGFYILFAFIFFTINIASILKGASKVLNEVLGGSLGVNHILLGLAVIFILYSFIGGLVASAWSDFLQGFMIISLSFMLIPLGWGLLGGFDGMKQTLPAYNFSLATPKEIGPWFIMVLTLNGLIGIMAQPHMMAAVGTGKDEHACRVGFFHGNYVKRLCTVGWAIVGLMVAVMVARGMFGTHSLPDPEDAFGFACRQLLSPGFRGLLVASVMGASLASCAALMVDSGALFTEGLYRQRLVRGRSDRHYLWVGRASGLAAVLIAIVYALFFIQRVLYSFLLTETMATFVGISIVIGIVWKRANRWGAAASVLAAFSTNFFLYHVKNERLDYWDPNIFLAALTAGVLGLVLVSLWTRPEPESKLTHFMGQLQASTDMPPQLSADSAAAVQDLGQQTASNPVLTIEPSLWAAENGRQLLMVNLLHLRRGACGVGFLKAYREDVKGLAIGFALSIGLIFGVWLLLRM